jgi:hypothetical protein
MLMQQWEVVRMPRWYTLLAGVLLTIGVVGLLVGLMFPVVGGLALLWMVAYFVVGTLTHVVCRDKLANVSLPLVFLVVFAALSALRWAELTPLLSSLHLV